MFTNVTKFNKWLLIALCCTGNIACSSSRCHTCCDCKQTIHKGETAPPPPLPTKNEPPALPNSGLSPIKPAPVLPPALPPAPVLPPALPPAPVPGILTNQPRPAVLPDKVEPVPAPDAGKPDRIPDRVKPLIPLIPMEEPKNLAPGFGAAAPQAKHEVSKPNFDVIARMPPPDYSTFIGKLEFLHTKQQWRIRYASFDVDDIHGGVFTLQGIDHIDMPLKEGMTVRVQGLLVEPDTRKPSPDYFVHEINVAE
jgi:hypothetical protein